MQPTQNKSMADPEVKRLQSLLSKAQTFSVFLAERLRKPCAQDDATGEVFLPEQPDGMTGGILRAYQIEGLAWLISLYENGMNGILADEMGLGKTVMCIAFLQYLREMGIPGYFLIVAPLSVIQNWKEEFKKFVPSMEVCIYHGDKGTREALRRDRFPTVTHSSQSVSVVITSFEMALKDSKILGKYSWKYLIVDEGHRLKNMNCKLLKELKSLKTDNRLLLTGTPLQNNLIELWSLLNFLLPEVFENVDDFMNWFEFSTSTENLDSPFLDEIEAQRVITQLHAILKPLLLRRLKTDVEKELPPKREYIISMPLTDVQAKLYNSILDGRLREFSYPGLTEHLKSRVNRVEYDDEEVSDGFASCSLSMQNQIMQLRKVCNHPYLFFYPLKRSSTEMKVDRLILESSSKMIILDQLLDNLLSSNHKVLVFCQMAKVLDILEGYIKVIRKGKYCRIDGSTPHDERLEQIRLFNKDSKRSIFLLTTRAGGLGLNLVTADTVIFFDSDWNPQADLQAQDRVHRIGQTKPVLVFRLSTRGTIEEQLLERASFKRRLERLLIHRKRFKGGKQLIQGTDDRLSTEELKSLLSDSLPRGESAAEANNESSSNCFYLTQSELHSIMDRSQESYSVKIKESLPEFIKRC